MSLFSLQIAIITLALHSIGWYFLLLVYHLHQIPQHVDPFFSQTLPNLYWNPIHSWCLSVLHSWYRYFDLVPADSLC